MITHRLSNVLKADNIFVFENGNLYEQGTHDYLLQKKDVYYKLFKNEKN